MRTKSVIILLLAAFAFVMAGTRTPVSDKKKRAAAADTTTLAKDSILRDSSKVHIGPDTTKMD